MAVLTQSVKRQFYLLVILWVAYFFLSRLALGLPHWKAVSTINYINYDLFYIIFILSLFIFRKEKHYPYIFFNLAVVSFFFLLGFLVMFIGKDYTIGDDRLMYIAWFYRRILISSLVLVMCVFLPTTYIFRQVKPVFRYLITLAIVTPIVVFHFKQYFLDWTLTQVDQNQYDILSSAISLNSLGISFLAVYGFLYLFHGRAVPKYINPLIIGWLFFLFVDINDNYFLFHQKDLPAISQWFLLFNLIFFCYILMRKLLYMHSSFGIFYDDLLVSKVKLGIKVIQKKGWTERLIMLLKVYFKPLYKKIFFVFLMTISFVYFVLFFPYSYTKMNLIILFLIFCLLIIYLNALVGKRIRSRFMLPTVENSKKGKGNINNGEKMLNINKTKEGG